MKRRAIVFVMLLLSILMSNVVRAQDTSNIFTVGMLTNFFYDEPFIGRMSELGYVEGQNIQYMKLVLEPDQFFLPPDQMQIQTQAMIDAEVDLFLVSTDTEAVNLRQLTDIPIVFIISDDPVVTGAVADLTAPGGNTTGVVSNRHHERRLQLLTEVMPTSTVYYLYGPASLEGETILQRVQEIGSALGVEVIAAPAGDPTTGIETLQNAPEALDWLFLTPYVTFDQAFYQLMYEVSASHNAPIASFFGTPSAFNLINYGPNLALAGEQAAEIVDQIIRGANPGEIPVVIAENSLAVNLEIAERMGIEIPEAILRQANFISRAGDFDEFGFPVTPTSEGT